jgi:hypothetical protein
MLTVTDPTNNAIVCQTTNGVRQGIVANDHAINLAACPSLPNNQYLIALSDPDHHSKDMLYSTEMINQGQFTPVNGLIISRRSAHDKFQVTTSSGYRTTAYVLFDLNPMNTNIEDGSCEVDASPLVIDTAPFIDNGHGLSLSDPSKGIMFDILGGNSFPAAHAKKQISWITNPNLMFIVLPAATGQVYGIDQMFGNNTMGPDGKYAPNGFAALAKYDLNHDGVIDSKDAVYSSLRLWSDSNLDGVTQAGELHTLKEMGIKQINLRYNRHFSEEDQYGNLTRFESNASYVTGQVRRVFDIWFAIH